MCIWDAAVNVLGVPLRGWLMMTRNFFSRAVSARSRLLMSLSASFTILFFHYSFHVVSGVVACARSIVTLTRLLGARAGLLRCVVFVQSSDVRARLSSRGREAGGVLLTRRGDARTKLRGRRTVR